MIPLKFRFIVIAAIVAEILAANHAINQFPELTPFLAAAFGLQAIGLLVVTLIDIATSNR